MKLTLFTFFIAATLIAESTTLEIKKGSQILVPSTGWTGKWLIREVKEVYDNNRVIYDGPRAGNQHISELKPLVDSVAESVIFEGRLRHCVGKTSDGKLILSWSRSKPLYELVAPSKVVRLKKYKENNNYPNGVMDLKSKYNRHIPQVWEAEDGSVVALSTRIYEKLSDVPRNKNGVMDLGNIPSKYVSIIPKRDINKVVKLDKNKFPDGLVYNDEGTEFTVEAVDANGNVLARRTNNGIKGNYPKRQLLTPSQYSVVKETFSGRKKEPALLSGSKGVLVGKTADDRLLIRNKLGRTSAVPADQVNRKVNCITLVKRCSS